jgi:Zn-dependent protease with chaperone function
MSVTVALFAYAAFVVTCAPRILAGSWQQRCPRLALTLWHAAALSALLALALAGLSCLAKTGLVAACLQALTGRDDAAGTVSIGLGIVVPVLLTTRLAIVLARLVRSQRADRTRHLDLLRLLGRPGPGADTTVIPAAIPAAYCVPGAGRIVLTDAAVALLDRSELRAVLAHERAHLAGRHHLVVTWSTCLAQAFPRVPLFRAVRRATADLVELLADDRAVRRESGDTLAGAIAALGLGRDAPAGLAPGLAASGGAVVARVQRLLDPPRPLSALTRVGGAGAAASLVALPTLPIALHVVAAACPHLFG